MVTQPTIPSQLMTESIGQIQWYTGQSTGSTGPSSGSQISSCEWEMSCLPLKGVGPTCQHELGYFISRSCTLSPTHSFATLPLSLYTPRIRMNPRTRERKDWKGDWRRRRRERREAPTPLYGYHEHLQPCSWWAQEEKFLFPRFFSQK